MSAAHCLHCALWVAARRFMAAHPGEDHDVANAAADMLGDVLACHIPPGEWDLAIEGIESRIRARRDHVRGSPRFTSILAKGVRP
jgi:hypothetical protein